MSEKTKLEQLQEQREKQRADRGKQEAAQFEKDFEALVGLEVEHDRVAAVKVTFVPGLPTRAFLRAPTRLEYQRYRDMVGRAVEKKNIKAQSEAQDQLAKSCWVYPSEAKERDAMLEAFPGLLASIVLEATKLAEGKAEEEGKD